MITIFLAAAFALINFVRGRGFIPYGEHVVAPIAWSLITGFLASGMGYSLAYAIAIGVVIFLGMLVWMVGIKKGWGGWGRYFAAWTWEWHPAPEVPWIDALGLKIVPLITPSYHWTNGLRGTICMSIRGLYIWPLFFMLSVPLYGLIVGLLQGVVYGSMHWFAPANGTKYAEPVYAAIVGAVIAQKLIAGF